MLTDVGLPKNVFDQTYSYQMVDQQLDIACEASLAETMQAQLNLDQYSCFQTIIAAITDDLQTAYFYLQELGRTSKTFLYQTICYYYQSQGKTVLCVASTGIAALLLPDRRTSYSQFQILLQLDKSSVSMITKTSQLGACLRSTDLIIWDKVPMQHKYYFKVVYQLIVDLQSVIDNVLFGSILIILRGNFAQILPVVPHGLHANIVHACLQQTQIWLQLCQLSLQVNMHVCNNLSELDFVNQISSLLYNLALNSLITLLPFILYASTVIDLINYVYLQD